MDEPLITVVVPVYNVEQYINKCLDSIINQEYKNLEIILVDDGSTDNCPKICDEYAEHDKRVKVIHQKNGGLSHARNVGIDYANGKYISFIDSDDYVEKNYIKLLYDTLKKYNTKLSMGDCQIKFASGKIVNTSTYKSGIVNIRDVYEKMLYGYGIRDLDVAACCKLYDISLFKDIRYPVGKYYEDTFTTYKIFNQIDKLALCSFPIYNYMIRSNSITQSKFTNKKMEVINANEEMTDSIINRYPELKLACKRRYIWSYMSTLSQIANSNYNDKETINMLREYVLKNKKYILKNKKVIKRDKYGVYCLVIGFNFYKFVWRLYKKIDGRI